MEKLEAELDRYLKIISHDPKSIVFVQLGETYRKMGKLDEAIGILEEGVKNHPNYASGHISLGRCMADSGQIDRAITEFEMAIKSSPDNILAYKLLAAEYKKKQDQQSCIRTYQKLLTISPKDQEGLAFLAERGLSAAAPKPEEKITSAGPQRITVEKNPVLQNPAPPKEEKIPMPVQAAPVVALPPQPVLISKPDTIAEPSCEKPHQAAEPEERKLEFYTATLAQIYLKQGLKTEAVEIYEILIKKDPQNKNYRSVLEDLKKPPENRIVELKTAGGNGSAKKSDEPAAVKPAPDPKINKLKNLLDLVKIRKRQI